MADLVFVEIAPYHFRSMPLAEALLAGAVRNGRKTWPSGVRDVVYRIPDARREKRDDGQRGIGGSKVFLNAREKESLYNFTGVRVDDAQHARRVMRQKGLRFTEKGERADEMFDALRDAPDDPSVGLGGMDLWGDESRRKPFDHREAFARNQQRFKDVSPEAYFREHG